LLCVALRPSLRSTPFPYTTLFRSGKFIAMTGKTCGNRNMTVFRVQIDDEVLIRCIGEHARPADIQVPVRLRHVLSEEITEIRFISLVRTKFTVHVFRFSIHSVIKTTDFQPGAINAREAIEDSVGQVAYESG